MKRRLRIKATVSLLILAGALFGGVGGQFVNAAHAADYVTIGGSSLPSATPISGLFGCVQPWLSSLNQTAVLLNQTPSMWADGTYTYDSWGLGFSQYSFDRGATWTTVYQRDGYGQADWLHYNGGFSKWTNSAGVSQISSQQMTLPSRTGAIARAGYLVVDNDHPSGRVVWNYTKVTVNNAAVWSSTCSIAPR